MIDFEIKKRASFIIDLWIKRWCVFVYMFREPYVHANPKYRFQKTQIGYSLKEACRSSSVYHRQKIIIKQLWGFPNKYQREGEKKTVRVQ